MIKIIDYGMGNTASMLNMIHKAGGNAELCSDVTTINNASAIILPGVGSFDNGIKKLTETGFKEILEMKVLNEKIPFLGVCLGMQLLFDQSEEGKLDGLGWINGNVTRFDFSNLHEKKGLKIPHMGWNIVKPKSYDNIYSDLENEARFYFVHSYHVNCVNKSNILAISHYGYEFTCSVRLGNIWGVQFHPEKSHRFGIQFFKNFLRLTNNA